MLTQLTVFIIIAGILCLLFLIAAIVSLKGRKPLQALISLLVMLLTLTIALLLGTLTVAITGYRAFTHEEIAAIVRIEPQNEKRFIAHMEYPDGHSVSYQMAGDQLYVDAYVIKWKPVVNLLGLHTAYELDRIGGRYINITDELQNPRTIYHLSRPKIIDLFHLRRRYLFLRFLLDAEYGSATFINCEKAATYEIRVSTSGLLAREAPSQ